MFFRRHQKDDKADRHASSASSPQEAATAAANIVAAAAAAAPPAPPAPAPNKPNAPALSSSPPSRPNAAPASPWIMNSPVLNPNLTTSTGSVGSDAVPSRESGNDGVYSYMYMFQATVPEERGQSVINRVRSVLPSAVVTRLHAGDCFVLNFRVPAHMVPEMLQVMDIAGVGLPSGFGVLDVLPLCFSAPSFLLDQQRYEKANAPSTMAQGLEKLFQTEDNDQPKFITAFETTTVQQKRSLQSLWSRVPPALNHVSQPTPTTEFSPTCSPTPVRPPATSATDRSTSTTTGEPSTASQAVSATDTSTTSTRRVHRRRSRSLVGLSTLHESRDAANPDNQTASGVVPALEVRDAKKSGHHRSHSRSSNKKKKSPRRSPRRSPRSHPHSHSHSHTAKSSSSHSKAESKAGEAHTIPDDLYSEPSTQGNRPPDDPRSVPAPKSSSTAGTGHHRDPSIAFDAVFVTDDETVNEASTARHPLLNPASQPPPRKENPLDDESVSFSAVFSTDDDGQASASDKASASEQPHSRGHHKSESVAFSVTFPEDDAGLVTFPDDDASTAEQDVPLALSVPLETEAVSTTHKDTAAHRGHHRDKSLHFAGTFDIPEQDLSSSDASAMGTFLIVDE
mmetsp:Transcript_8352/g.21076  ORF Transcript_8352/g.21076 Transcript_8352/m.21076 type:complete len:622 (-) Transcript_8352:90-1955(-)